MSPEGYDHAHTSKPSPEGQSQDHKDLKISFVAPDVCVVQPTRCCVLCNLPDVPQELELQIHSSDHSQGFPSDNAPHMIL
jgi:hypothetical protein